MVTFYGLAIAIASQFLRIFVQLNFIATVWEEIINDNHLFSFQYNGWSTQTSVWIPSNIFQLLVMLN